MLVFEKHNLDYFVTRLDQYRIHQIQLTCYRCLDISHFNEVERIQAIRLIRKLANLKRREEIDLKTTPVVPRSLVASIVSVSLGGAEERDRVYRTCVAVLCELGR